MASRPLTFDPQASPDNPSARPLRLRARRLRALVGGAAVALSSLIAMEAAAVDTPCDCGDPNNCNGVVEASEADAFANFQMSVVIPTVSTTGPDDAEFCHDFTVPAGTTRIGFRHWQVLTNVACALPTPVTIVNQPNACVTSLDASFAGIDIRGGNRKFYYYDVTPGSSYSLCRTVAIVPNCTTNITESRITIYDATDTDGDGDLNPDDDDDDNDGIVDAMDSAPLDPDVCIDSDMDGCDDCVVGDDDFGPNNDALPGNDGLDSDADGLCDDGDPDDDGDGVPDNADSDPFDPFVCSDLDGDGCDDCATLGLQDPDNDGIDTDGDGLCDLGEASLGTNATDWDTDDDGVPDGKEPDPGGDADNDGIINALDPDSDNDGIKDGTELGFDCSHPDTDPAANQCVPDGDGGATTTDPLDKDTDDGSVEDGVEDANKNGVVDSGEKDPNNPADDVPGEDSDGDGLTDSVEIAIGSDPNDADSDDDGIIDGQEPSLGEDSDGDGLINVLDPDSDNDGLADGTEVGNDCSHPDTDLTKGNCTPDADGGATTTDPLDADSDDGGVSDGNEDTNLNGQVDAGEIDPNNGADDVLIDSDGDGLGDLLEIAIGSDPMDADSDDDGVLDGDEPNFAFDTDGDGLINVLDKDSDADGLRDGVELGSDCSHPDSGVDCIPDGDGGTTTTSALDPDTDHGGVSDGDEDTNKNGVVDAGERDPNDPLDDNATPGGSEYVSGAGIFCTIEGQPGRDSSGYAWLTLLGLAGLYLRRRHSPRRSEA